MAQFKIHQSGGFTAVDNAMLRNKDISLKAKGLLCVMLSLPPEWNYSVNGLVAISKENLTAINTALHELKQFGYLTVTKILPGQSESGRIEYQYDVYAVAEENPNFQRVEKQGIQKQGIEILPLENPQQYNKDKVNKDKLNKENKTKKKENATALPSDDIEKEFELLWSLYPRKQGKSNALKAYEKARKNHPEIYKQVEDGIKAYIAYLKAKKTEPQYIKQGSTWFNQKCWEDDYTLGGNNDGHLTETDSRENGYDWDAIGINL